MKYFNLLLVFVLLTCFLNKQSLGQEVKTNNNGERIVVYSDGSWRYFEPADSILLKDQNQDRSFFQKDDNNINPFEDPNDSNLPDTALINEISRLINDRKAELNNRTIQYEKANAFRIETEDLLDSLYGAFPDVDENLIKKAERNLKISKDLEAKSKEDLKKAQDRFEAANRLLSLTGTRQKRALESLRDKPIQTEKNTGSIAQQINNQSGSHIQQSSYMDFLEKSTVSIIPETDCQVVESRDNSFQGARRIDTKPALFFTHTQKDMRPYLKGREFITNYANLTSISGFVYFNVQFVIAGKNAKSMFGRIEPNSLLQIRLINGETIRLYNSIYVAPTVEAITGSHVFEAHYILDKTNLKLLGKYEIDKIRVVWSTGYEDYEIYNVDFIKNHIHCLNKHL